MAGPLLETKFHVPRRRRSVVPRPRLIERLGRGADTALTLLSAPAGFGKTTLLTEWLHAATGSDRAAAWLSLDDRDNDASLFWTYVIAALQAATPPAAAGAAALLSTSPPTLEPVLATLLNDLHALPHEIVLVLDDYHAIEAPDVHDGVAYLLEHLPPQAHLVIAGRVDPPLPLARLRARGELVEIRAADLRFTSEEVAAYLNEAMALRLRAADVAALERRTEGWIAALQLAALSIEGRDDPTGFIAGFAGDDRFIVDYLVGEVLQRQPGQVRDFLLQTSILRRLNGALCDAVTPQEHGKATLEALERGNVFLVPLDDRRDWYRYHHLFAEVLRGRLLDEQGDHVSELHRRASDWYEQQGDRSEAIHHALAGGDFDRAADLIELAAAPLRRARQEATLRRWLEALPEELFRVRPMLNMGLVGVLMASGELEGVERRLQDAERWLDTTAGAGAEPDAASAPMVVVDEAGFRHLPSQIAVYRAAEARIHGDVAATIGHARRALELAGEDDHLGRGGAAGFLGLASWTLGELDRAHRWYSEARSSLGEAGHVPDVLGCTLALGDIRKEQGRLSEALRTYEHGLTIASGQDAVPRGTADLHAALAEVLLERDDLDGAVLHLRTSRDLGEHAGFAQNRYRWRAAMAQARSIEGEVSGALALLDDAERLTVSDYFPDVRPIPARRARLQAARGEVGDALRWARQRAVSVDDDLSYLREYEHITLTRVLLARHATDPAGRALHDAGRLLERLLVAAEEGARTGSVIEILVLRALLHDARDERPAALAALDRALTLAEPEGHVRVLLDEGAALTALLRTAARRSAARGLARRVLAAVGQPRIAPPGRQPLVEPLSERELEVLRLLRTDLDGPDIARELGVSLNTLRTHTRHIYAKLSVNSRRAAIRRAEELDL